MIWCLVAWTQPVYWWCCAGHCFVSSFLFAMDLDLDLLHLCFNWYHILHYVISTSDWLSLINPYVLTSGKRTIERFVFNHRGCWLWIKSTTFNGRTWKHHSGDGRVGWPNASMIRKRLKYIEMGKLIVSSNRNQEWQRGTTQDEPPIC